MISNSGHAASRRSGIITLAIVLVLSGLISYVWAIAPSLRQLDRARVAELNLKQTFERKQQLAAQQDARRGRIEELPDPAADMVLRAQDDESSSIAKFASESGMTILQTELVDSVADEFTEYLEFEVKASGSFPEIVSFLARLGTGRRLFFPASINLERGEAGIRANLLLASRRYTPLE